MFKIKLAAKICGQKHRLVKQYTKISHREHFILNQEVDNWNSLLMEVLEATSKENFKKKLDEFLAPNQLQLNTFLVLVNLIE